MNEIIIAAELGALGAIVRLGVLSLEIAQMKKKIVYMGFFAYMLTIIAIGAFSGIVLGYGKVLSFLAGYAGTDLMDGYYKVFKAKKVKLEK
jgi:hypothetical protein